MPHSSLEQTLQQLQLQSPDSTFLALGQTVFWDEPIKASWRRILDRHWPSAQLVVGIHDTDYFAKTTAHVPDDQEFLALAHDDGATRGLWSAAGELSSLFGSEDVPTRAFYESVGIPFDKLAGSSASERRAFFAEHTSAFGWRGIVQTSGNAQISHDVSAKTYGPALIDLLTWGFGESISNLAGQTAIDAAGVASTIKGWVSSFLESCTDTCTLSDLYQFLLPKFYELLLDIEPTNFSVTATSSLLLFNPSTAQLPRFRFLQLFLDPATRGHAVAAYSKAVAGGGMYSLDHFGENAIPFDLVKPGLGRGTIHVSTDNITIDIAMAPIQIATSEPVTSVQKLAEILAERFGDDVVVVGKAVSLISMLAAEFTVLFHETASGYTDRTLAMNDHLREIGIELPLNPIVRIQYNTWDSLHDVHDCEFQLPKHLDDSFKTAGGTITASDFSIRWRDVISQEQHKLKELAKLKSLKQLLEYLRGNSNTGSGYWQEKLDQVLSNTELIQKNHRGLEKLRSERRNSQASRYDLHSVRRTLEERSADDYHTRLRPLQEMALSGDTDAAAKIHAVELDRTDRFELRIARYAGLIREEKRKIREITRSIRTAERTSEVISARAATAAIYREANLAKLSIARSAFISIHSLSHTNARPTSWWLPMVDPKGIWFDNITDSLEVRLEHV